MTPAKILPGKILFLAYLNLSGSPLGHPHKQNPMKVSSLVLRALRQGCKVVLFWVRRFLAHPTMAGLHFDYQQLPSSIDLIAVALLLHTTLSRQFAPVSCAWFQI